MHRVLPLFAVLLLAFAPAPFPKPLRGELNQLQGTWVLEINKQTSDEYFQIWGEPHPVESVEIDKNRVRNLRNREKTVEWRITLTEKGTPRTFTLDMIPSVPEGYFFKGRVRGIYRLEGDRLSLRINGANLNSPPGSFTANGADFQLLVYRRKKS